MTWLEPWDRAYRCSVAEDAVGFAESLSRGMRKGVAETLKVVESHSRKMIKSLLVDLAVSETYVDNIAFTMRAFESLWLDEAVGKKVFLPFSEDLGVSETEASRRICIGVGEALGVAEVFGRTVAYRLALAEFATVVEALSKASRITANEALSLYDEYLRKSNAVISDMITDTGDITEAELLMMVENGHAPGFGQFKQFIPGDYDVQKALFRVVLTSKGADRTRLNEMSVQADVPDVFDRGMVEITAAQAAAGVRVAFTRTFHIVPEITLTLKGGTVVAVPDVIASDEYGFTVVLKNPATGERVAGRVSWAAHGY